MTDAQPADRDMSGPHTSGPHSSDPDKSHPGPIGLLRAIDAKAHPNLKRAVPAVLLTLLSYGVGASLGGVRRSTPAVFDHFGLRFVISAGWITVVVVCLTLIFIVAGVVANRSVAREMARVSSNRAGVAAGSAIRLIFLTIGYLTVGLGTLALLQVNLGNLLVGGAVTGVVVGIAAQQTLGNFFAGLVLLFAKPYVPGQRVKIRSGGMGGPFEGVITGAGLMYTTIDTDEGIVSMPNSGLLGAAVGPAPEPEPTGDEQADEAAS